mgnify:CR=1 FL=1
MIIDANKDRYIICGNIDKSYDKKNYVGVFRGKSLWLLFENEDYEKNMKMDFPTEFYKNKHNVPKYTVMKGGKKFGSLLPRVHKDTGDKYLFFTSMKGHRNRGYYIWRVDDSYNVKRGLRITFDIKSDYF